MSAVTASIIVGTRHRSDPGIQPRWLVLLHEGSGYAWHLIRLQLTGGDVSRGPDDAPGVLWRAAPDGDLVGELALMLHLYAARTPEIVQALRRCPSLRRHRLDLAELAGPELGDVENAIRIAKSSGRELLLAATILRESRLTEEALLGLPGWELNVSHSVLTRAWDTLAGGLVVTDHRVEAPADEFAEEFDEEFVQDVDDTPSHEELAWSEHAEPTPAGSRRGEPARDETPADTRAPESEDGGEPDRDRPEDEDWDVSADVSPPRRRLWPHRRPVIQKTERPTVGLAEFFGRTDD